MPSPTYKITYNYRDAGSRKKRCKTCKWFNEITHKKGHNEYICSLMFLLGYPTDDRIEKNAVCDNWAKEKLYTDKLVNKLRRFIKKVEKGV